MSSVVSGTFKALPWMASNSLQILKKKKTSLTKFKIYSIYHIFHLKISQVLEDIKVNKWCSFCSINDMFILRWTIANTLAKHWSYWRLHWWCELTSFPTMISERVFAFFARPCLSSSQSSRTMSKWIKEGRPDISCDSARNHSTCWHAAI